MKGGRKMDTLKLTPVARAILEMLGPTLANKLHECELESDREKLILRIEKIILNFSRRRATYPTKGLEVSQYVLKGYPGYSLFLN